MRSSARPQAMALTPQKLPTSSTLIPSRPPKRASTSASIIDRATGLPGIGSVPGSKHGPFGERKFNQTSRSMNAPRSGLVAQTLRMPLRVPPVDRSFDDLPHGEPQAYVRRLTQEPDEHAADEASVQRRSRPQDVVRQGLHVGAQLVVAVLSDDPDPLFPPFGQHAEDEIPEGSEGGMIAHVAGLHARGDHSVVGAVVAPVAAAAADGLSEDERPTDQLAEADDVEVRAGSEGGQPRRRRRQDQRQQGPPEHP